MKKNSLRTDFRFLHVRSPAAEEVKAAEAAGALTMETRDIRATGIVRTMPHTSSKAGMVPRRRPTRTTSRDHRHTRLHRILRDTLRRPRLSRLRFRSLHNLSSNRNSKGLARKKYSLEMFSRQPRMGYGGLL